MELKNILLILIALFLDLIDYIGGFIPGIGDILDIFGPLILYIISRDPILLGGLVEIVPLVDFIPTNLGLAAYHIYQGRFED